MKTLSDVIIEMMNVDQNARKAAYDAQMRGEDITTHKHLVYTIDAAHNQRIRQLIAKHGYPTKKMIGAKALKAFWLLVQHQDFDLELQRACLERCDFAPTEKAYLIDRVLVAEGKKQRFGTQFTRKNGKSVPHPIQDRKSLGKRRKEHGLPPFTQYAASMRKANPPRKTKGR